MCALGAGSMTAQYVRSLHWQVHGGYCALCFLIGQYQIQQWHRDSGKVNLVVEHKPSIHSTSSQRYWTGTEVRARCRPNLDQLYCTETLSETLITKLKAHCCLKYKCRLKHLKTINMKLVFMWSNTQPVKGRGPLARFRR